MSSASSANPAPNSGLRIVFDTNIYIAAFLRPGLSEELVQRGLQGEFEIIISQHILNELKQKLTSQKEFSPAVVSHFMELIKERVRLVKVTKVESVVKRDPQDDHILACAQAGKANLLISLDQDLLSLKEWKGIAIIHPKTLSWIMQNNS